MQSDLHVTGERLLDAGHHKGIHFRMEAGMLN